MAIDTSKFYVISVCSNPVRFKSRYRLFEDFKVHMNNVGAKMLIVEQAFGERTHEITDRYNPFHIQLRSRQEVWLKENMINVGIQHLTKLDPNWEYVAWVDGDILFQRQDIVTETVHQLQHYSIVQMFSHCIDTGPELQPIKTHTGFMYCYHQNDCNPPQGYGINGYYSAMKGFWHPGYAWAARRDAIEKVPLLDFAVLGAGDHHMALGLIGEAARSVPGNTTCSYTKAVVNWQEMAEHHLRRNVGYVPGTIMHHWHGKKKDRKYKERWEIILKNDFDPYLDIIKDPQGLWMLNEHRPKFIRLRDDFRAYFRSRNEDSIDLDEDGQ